MLLTAPPESVSVTVGFVPSGAGPKPLTASPPTALAARPSFCWTLTVNVWLSPMLFVSSGVIAILASTNRLTASPEFCPVAVCLDVSRHTVDDDVRGSMARDRARRV